MSILVAVAFLSSACNRSGGSGDAAGEVKVYMWSEYIDPAIVEDFERQTGLAVRLSVYERTEDMMAKLRHAGGAEQYDVVIMSDHAVPVMAKAGLIRPLDAGKLPHLVNVADRFKAPPYDPGGKFSVPYQWGTMGILYRKDKLGEIEPSWGVLLAPARVPGTFVLIDSKRDMLAAALKYEGHSVNSKQPAEVGSAADLIARAKAHDRCKGFEAGVEGKNKVVAGEQSLAIVYNGDGVRALAEEPATAFVLPREGSIIWVDAMTITAKAPNADGAHRFIDFILDPAVGAKLSNFTRFASPNTKAIPLINEADRNNPVIYPPEEDIRRMEYLEDLGESARLYDEAWTSIKNR